MIIVSVARTAPEDFHLNESSMHPIAAEANNRLAGPNNGPSIIELVEVGRAEGRRVHGVVPLAVNVVEGESAGGWAGLPVLVVDLSAHTSSGIGPALDIAVTDGGIQRDDVGGAAMRLTVTTWSR